MELSCQLCLPSKGARGEVSRLHWRAQGPSEVSGSASSIVCLDSLEPAEHLPRLLRAPHRAGSFCHGFYPLCMFLQLIHSWGCPPSCAEGDEGLSLQWRCISKSAHQVVFFWKVVVWVPVFLVWVKEATGGCFYGRVSEGHCRCRGCMSRGSGCSWLAWGCQVDTAEPCYTVCAAGQAPTQQDALWFTSRCLPSLFRDVPKVSSSPSLNRICFKFAFKCKLVS